MSAPLQLSVLDGCTDPLERLRQLKRLAILCGDGEVLFPTDLPPDELLVLARFVHEHRRHQLMEFLVEQVARNLTKVT